MTFYRLNKKNLPGEFSTTEKDGVYAEFAADGTITHWGQYLKDQTYELIRVMDMDPDKGTASLSEYEKIIFVPKETLNPDLPQPQPQDQYELFVKSWISKIKSGMGFEHKECRLCGKIQGEVELVAGPYDYICFECIELCEDIMEVGLEDQENSQDQPE